MIKITLYKKAITCIGHADYAEEGKDIYCAGISAVLLSSLNWFNKNDIEYTKNKGIFKFKIVNATDDNLYKLSLLQKQIKAFNQKEYKKYIEIDAKRKDYYE